MIIMFPASFVAQDSARAMLHTGGGTWLNESPAPNSSAIFENDLIQTQKFASAKIDAEGSMAIVHPETMVQFEGDELALDHGHLEVNTSRNMKVRVNCITITPLSSDRTHYDVTDVNGKVQVAAIQNDVRIHYSGGSAEWSKQAAKLDTTVHQGEQVTREERCGSAYVPGDAVDARGPILNSTWAKIAGTGIVATLTCLGVCRGDDPISPSGP